jgi:hypothetical protein
MSRVAALTSAVPDGPYGVLARRSYEHLVIRLVVYSESEQLVIVVASSVFVSGARAQAAGIKRTGEGR